MFLRIGAGSGAPWLPWYDGGRHGSMCFIDRRVCCARFVRKLHLPATIRLFIAREQKIPPLAGKNFLYPIPLFCTKLGTVDVLLRYFYSRKDL